MAKEKERLDVILVARGLAPSREKAKALIMEGNVFVNGEREDKPGTTFDTASIKDITVKGDELPFVSRGGLKLRKAVDKFGLILEDKVCMDIGASTGGFTDCMLQNGARKVYSVDVGYGQLDWKLRSDDRVVCMEKTNFRYLQRENIDDDLDFASCNVSFISLTKILIPARKLLKDGGEMVCLIKPQFEAGKDKVGKKGVVREALIHSEVIHKIADFVGITGFEILDLDYSPIKGPEGNVEFLIHIRKDPDRNPEVSELTEADAEALLKNIMAAKTGISHNPDMDRTIEEVVQDAHGNLTKIN